MIIMIIILLHFFDELNEKEKYKGKYNISYSSLYNAFFNDDIISPIAHQGTIKLYNEKINNAINQKEIIQEEKLDLFKSRQISFERHILEDIVICLVWGKKYKWTLVKKK